MKWNTKAMIGAGLALMAALAAAYAVMPAVRALILGIGPYLLLLLCPLSMWLMTKSMSGHDERVGGMRADRHEQETDPLRRRK